MSRNWLEFTRGSLPVVNVRIGAQRYRALIDTGAYVSFIALDMAIGLGLPRDGFLPVVGISGQRESLPVVDLPAIGIAQVQLAPCRAAVRNLKSLGLNIELILGVNAFAQHRLQIDFINGRIYLLE